jgi:hypothetical protein
VTTQTPTLADFLLARIAEDEAEARAAITARVPAVLVGPERLLAECNAKLRILEDHAPKAYRGLEAEEHAPEPDPRPLSNWVECRRCFDWGSSGGDYDFLIWPCLTLRALALSYADHPNYQEEWRP